MDKLLLSEFLRAAAFQQQEAVVAELAQQLCEVVPLDSAREAAQEAEAGLEEALQPLVAGLRRTGQLEAVLGELREAAAEDVKQGIRCDTT